MDRIHLLARSTLSQTLASIFRTLNETRRVRTENGRIDALPRDRLEDIGITDLQSAAPTVSIAIVNDLDYRTALLAPLFLILLHPGKTALTGCCDFAT